MKAVTLLIVLLALTVQSSYAEPPVPRYIAPSAVEKNQQDKTTVAFPVDSGPEFIVPTADLLAITATSQTKDNTVTVSVRPLRLLHERRWLWGFSLLGSYQTDKTITTFGPSYRFEPRWVFEKCYSNMVAKTHQKLSETSGSLDSDEFLRQLMMAIDNRGISLIPALTVGYQVGLFANDLSGEERKAFAKQNATLGLNWDYGNYIDIQGTLSYGRQRADAVKNTKLVDVTSASASITWIVPALVGAKYYDTYYLTNLYQRGIGIGPVFSYTFCGASGDDRASCPNSIVRDLLVGGAVDLRISKDITPRFTIGERWVKNFKSGTDGAVGTIEGGVQLVYTIK